MTNDVATNVLLFASPLAVGLAGLAIFLITAWFAKHDGAPEKSRRSSIGHAD